MRFAVLGLGNFGRSVAETLHSLGHSVWGVDNDEENIDYLVSKGIQCYQFDATDEEGLRELHIEDVDTVIVGMSDLGISVQLTLLLKRLGVQNVVARASTELHADCLRRVGADRVVFPESDIGMRVARTMVSTNFMDIMELSPEYSIVEIEAPDCMIDLTLRQLDLTKRFGVNVVGVRRGGDFRINPKVDEYIERGDVLMIIGHKSDLDRLLKMED
ncbi:MAG: TrkA family potassium uptake protein [Bacillota bacterium]